MVPLTETMSAAQARRIAIAAQHLHQAPRPPTAAPISRRHLRRLLPAIGVLQIDSVNVLARAHYVPIFSRLGPYQHSVLDDVVWPQATGQRILYESWAHMASMAPLTLEPYLRWQRNGGAVSWLAEHSDLARDVRAIITERGPMTAGGIEKVLAAPGRGKPGWWEWSQTKYACEKLFSDGVLGTAYRRGFQRYYDLMERIIPAEILNQPTPAVADAKRYLVTLAARHHGIGTVRDLADYYRLSMKETRTALRDMEADGVVRRVTVAGWKEPAFLHRDARIPRQVRGQALLCPFDPLIWERARTERLFGVRYRIEIYTPAHRRQYGYYVFPLLVGDKIVGRFDLKADRKAGLLRVQAAWAEPGTDSGLAAHAASEELARMTTWLDLDGIVVAPRGNLADALSLILS